jgi:hypothetical protein
MHAPNTDALTVHVGILASALRGARREGAAPYAPLPTGAFFSALVASGAAPTEPGRLAARVAGMQQRLDRGDFDLGGGGGDISGGGGVSAATATAATAGAPARRDGAGSGGGGEGAGGGARSEVAARADTRAYLAQKFRHFFRSEESIIQGVALGVLDAATAAAMMAGSAGGAPPAGSAAGGGVGGGEARAGRAGLGAQ